MSLRRCRSGKKSPQIRPRQSSLTPDDARLVALGTQRSWLWDRDESDRGVLVVNGQAGRSDPFRVVLAPVQQRDPISKLTAAETREFDLDFAQFGDAVSVDIDPSGAAQVQLNRTGSFLIALTVDETGEVSQGLATEQLVVDDGSVTVHLVATENEAAQFSAEVSTLVSDLTGATIEDAKIELSREGLVFGTAGTVCTENEARLVTHTSPPADEQVPVGSTVEVEADLATPAPSVSAPPVASDR